MEKPVFEILMRSAVFHIFADGRLVELPGIASLPADARTIINRIPRMRAFEEWKLAYRHRVAMVAGINEMACWEE